MAAIRYYNGLWKFLAWFPEDLWPTRLTFPHRISREAGLPRARETCEFGLSYRVNAMCRSERVAQLKHAILTFDQTTVAIADI